MKTERGEKKELLLFDESENKTRKEGDEMSLILLVSVHKWVLILGCPPPIMKEKRFVCIMSRCLRNSRGALGKPRSFPLQSPSLPAVI